MKFSLFPRVILNKSNWILDDICMPIQVCVCLSAYIKRIKLYDSLYKYYEELQEDDAVKDTIIDNDYEFDEDGNII